jgi:hypothetical protein
MIRRLVLGVSVVSLGSVVAAVGCGGGSNPSGFGEDGGNGGSSSGGGQSTSSSGGTGLGNGDGGGTTLGVGDGGGTGNGCSAASQLVYVLSKGNAIYSFAPQTKAFTKISSLQCNAGSMSPNSMAVDREGNAWVNYASFDALGNPTAGSIFKVTIATGACAATNITLKSGWYQLGMGFSTVSATDTTDTLYVAATGSAAAAACLGFGGGGGGNTSAGLGSLDTVGGTLTAIGPFTGDLAGQSAELTGTGDGRLFGFFVDSPVKVAQIAKTSGATSNEVSMTGVACPQAWAFSFWGGDFYLYTSPDGTTDSTVTHYTTADGGIDTSYVSDTGMVIVGAGVSTCAPTTPPPVQ